MKYFYTLLLSALLPFFGAFAQNTIATSNFGSDFSHNQSLTGPNDHWTHTGAGDFVHKIISGSGASGSNCFGQLGTSGAASAYTKDSILLHAGNTYELRAYLKTVNSRIYCTTKFRVGGVDVASSGNTSANGSWEEVVATYTPTADEYATVGLVKTQGQLVNIDKIKLICTTCSDKNYVFNFEDSKEGFLSGGGSTVHLGNDGMIVKSTNNTPVVRSGNTTANLNLSATDFDRARIVFKTPYASAGTGFGKLFFYSLSGGNAQFATFDFYRNPSNNSSYQEAIVDLSATPASGNYSGDIARIGLRGPWGVSGGDTVFIQRIELFNQPTHYDVTLSVNTANITVGANGMYAGGGVLGGANAVALSDPDGDGTWTGLASFPIAGGNYVFLNSPNDGNDWGAKEDLIGQSCADGQWSDRLMPSITGDTTVLACFASCESDGSCPAPPTDFNVTFSVNTANITVGANGMYAGGGILGGSNALALSDPDGDGVWTGDTILPGAGGGSRNFVFFNSPNGNADWGSKEVLAGLPCADAANYDDRNLPTFNSDTTLLYCFGACETDGTCPSPPSTVNVTFNVNMENYMAQTGNPTPNMFINGTFNGWCGSCNPMSQINNTEWEVTLPLNIGDTIEYKFTVDGWNDQEQFTGGEPCTLTTGTNVNRVLSIPSSDLVLGLVCFNSCTNCVSVPALTFTGIMDLTVPTGGSDGKAIQLTANQNISDLSLYSVNSFSNGNTSSGTAFTFPNISVSAGQHIILCRDSVDLATYFGSCWSIFDHVIQGNQPTGNGDDAYELYMSGNTIETYGVVGVDGTGESWEYLDSWAWKDTAASNVGNWVYGGVNCSDGSSSMQTSNCPYPLCGSAPPSSNNVTFSVNTSNITVGPNGMYAGGGVLGDAMAVQLSDPDGDGTWTGVAQINVGATGNYIFLNSPNNGGDWGAKENLAGQPCSDPANYDDRILPNISSDTVILHCFGSCETDGSCPAPPSDFIVTFNVNTANITVGPNGMYAGGGMIGGSDALALSDPDGDGVWTGDTILPGTGAGNRNFAFFNSPTHGSDWGTKENISGLPCADAANYDDRNLPIFYSDTTLLYCFGACETDGSCPTPPTAVNVTFQVDMNQSGYANATPYLRGSWNWGGSGDMMSDSNGDNIWDFTKTFTGGSNEYIFAIDTNNSGSWDVNEVNDPNEPCTNGNAQYTNRVLVLPSADSVFGAVCLGSCSPCGPPPTTFYNVVFMVNTANITVGPNGMYAGGGALGDAMAVSLVEIDTITGFPAPGSNIWVGVDTLPSNITGNYIFLNSPNNGSDWAAKENLGGQPCADTNNYNDRILPPITANNTVLRHCFGSCQTGGSCPAPPSDFIVTFSVNTANITVGPNGMYAGGGMIGGSDALALSDPDGDGIWTGDTLLPGTGAGSRNFVFFNSPNGSADWGSKEVLTGLPCADAANFDDRNLPMFYSDTTLLYCFGACETDGSCPTPPTAVNVTFQVDMNQSGYANATPYLRGSWNWGGPGDLMNDADGDNVWDLSFPLIGSSFEFIYAIDTTGSGAWDINETNDPNEPCTNGNTQYTNRVLNVPSSDSTLGVVCLGSCSACTPSTGLYSLTDATINIYPNPANELVTILSSYGISSIEVRDIVGRVVYQSNNNSKKVTINTSSLSNNVYIVRCLINDKVVIKKFTINH